MEPGSSGVPLYVVDAFAQRPFSGNPAAVVLLEGPRDEAWMQSVSAEMKHAETAFVSPGESGVFPLRWFTPLKEVDLCGHATMAAAHALWSHGVASTDGPIRFSTRSGELTVSRQGSGFVMDFPSEHVEEMAMVEVPTALREGVGGDPVWFGRNRLDWFVVLGSEADVVNADPDMEALVSLPERGVIITAPADADDADYVHRYFAPSFGIAEDDATGSIQCALGPYWTERLGKAVVVGLQRSPRGVRMQVRSVGDRVFIEGQVATVIEGRLLV